MSERRLDTKEGSTPKKARHHAAAAGATAAHPPSRDSPGAGADVVRAAVVDRSSRRGVVPRSRGAEPRMCLMYIIAGRHRPKTIVLAFAFAVI